jgi:transcriptional regulator with XRE-family HTH domain
MEKSVFSKDYRIFLRQLRQARSGSGLTQEQLARRLGWTQSLVSKCERGERRLDIVEVRRICAALGLDFGRFVARVHRAIARGDD